MCILCIHLLCFMGDGTDIYIYMLLNSPGRVNSIVFICLLLKLCYSLNNLINFVLSWQLTISI